MIALALTACGSRTELDGTTRSTSDAASTCAGPITRDLSVPIAAPWFDTGIDVVAGTDVVMKATGTVHYGPMAAQSVDANGGNFDGTQFFSTAVYPKVIVCSLIGKIGGTTALGSGTPVPSGSKNESDGFVGVDYHEVMKSSGRLFLGFNDQVGQFGDNSGAFDLTITTTNPCP